MTYIVTGASSGIGHAVASSLLLQGQSVVAVARDEARLNTLVQHASENLKIVVADLSTDQGLESLIQSVSSIKQLAGIVHAAGSHIDLEAYSQINAEKMCVDFFVHVTTPISINNRLVNKFVGASILFIDSYSASNLRVGWSGYSIIKSAAQMAARAAAAELKQSRVIRVFPGAVRTPLVETVLSSKQTTPVVELFKQIEADGNVNEASEVGQFIANILIHATSKQLLERELWDFNNVTDQIFD